MIMDFVISSSFVFIFNVISCSPVKFVTSRFIFIFAVSFGFSEEIDIGFTV